jgi:phage terminase Nu1 subunit (DNA packaging protein)
MPTLAERATAYLAGLEADRRAAIAISEEKAQEAKLIEARQEGFKEALKIFELEIPSGVIEIEPNKTPKRARRNIPQLILRELSFSGMAMTKDNIARAIDYPSFQTERALKRLESSGKVQQNTHGRWEAATPIPVQPNGHAVAAP